MIDTREWVNGVRNKKAAVCFWLCGFMLLTAHSAEKPGQPRLKLGSTFRYDNTWSDEGRLLDKYPLNYELAAHEVEGYNKIVSTLDADPKTGDKGKAEIVSLPIDGCVIDVANTVALRRGNECDAPLPKAWVAKDILNEVLNCELMTSRPEKVTVPAGKFNAFQIKCGLARSSRYSGKETYTYWYAESLGIMVKVVYKDPGTIPGGSFIATSELESYKLK